MKKIFLILLLFPSLAFAQSVDTAFQALLGQQQKVELVKKELDIQEKHLAAMKKYLAAQEMELEAKLKVHLARGKSRICLYIDDLADEFPDKMPVKMHAIIVRDDLDLKKRFEISFTFKEISFTFEDTVSDWIEISGIALRTSGVGCIGPESTLYVLFKDGTKITLHNMNALNCDGRALFNPTTADLNALSSKPIEGFGFVNSKNSKDITKTAMTNPSAFVEVGAKVKRYNNGVSIPVCDFE